MKEEGGDEPREDHPGVVTTHVEPPPDRQPGDSQAGHQARQVKRTIAVQPSETLRHATHVPNMRLSIHFVL